jgi:integrase
MTSALNPDKLTVAQAVEYWLENRRTDVKRSTWKSYYCAAAYVVGPLLEGTRGQRYNFSRSGRKPPDGKFVQMLGPTLVGELTTGAIRGWHKTVTAQVSSYTANVAKKLLRAALALVAEDFGLPIPAMPSRTGRGRPRPTKTILTPNQVGVLLKCAQTDEKKGIYYAFPFLTGVRPSEQLALVWRDINFAAGIVHVRRMQEIDGSLCEFTKTTASIRDIPMSGLLKTMLLKWQERCPTANDPQGRVFPTLGRGRSSRHKIGRTLTYTNFIVSYWRPALLALGLPIVTPHSARHGFISTLQSEGIEVGLVAKLAGHANVSVTLGHYTQAVRGGQVAISALERAYGQHPQHGRSDRSFNPCFGVDALAASNVAEFMRADPMTTEVQIAESDPATMDFFRRFLSAG